MPVVTRFCVRVGSSYCHGVNMRVAMRPNAVLKITAVTTFGLSLSRPAIGRCREANVESVESASRNPITPFLGIAFPDLGALTFDDVTPYDVLRGNPLADCIGFHIGEKPAFAIVSQEVSYSNSLYVRVPTRQVCRNGGRRPAMTRSWPGVAGSACSLQFRYCSGLLASQHNKTLRRA